MGLALTPNLPKGSFSYSNVCTAARTMREPVSGYPMKKRSSDCTKAGSGQSPYPAKAANFISPFLNIKTMKTKINALDCILLVDDDQFTNYVNLKVIEKAQIKTHIQVT